MPETNIPIDKECSTEFTKLNMHKAYRFIIFGMDDNFSKIQILTKGDINSSHEDMIKLLPKDDCRYVVYSVDFEVKDGGKRNKTVFIGWSPDSAKVKTKMIYTSSKKAFKKALPGSMIDVQANSLEQVTWNSIIERCMQFVRV